MFQTIPFFKVYQRALRVSMFYMLYMLNKLYTCLNHFFVLFQMESYHVMRPFHAQPRTSVLMSSAVAGGDRTDKSIYKHEK